MICFLTIIHGVYKVCFFSMVDDWFHTFYVPLFNLKFLSCWLGISIMVFLVLSGCSLDSLHLLLVSYSTHYIFKTCYQIFWKKIPTIIIYLLFRKLIWHCRQLNHGVSRQSNSNNTQLISVTPKIFH